VKIVENENEVIRFSPESIKINPVSKLDLRSSLEKITLEGAFAMVFIVLTGGAFLTGFALLLGANDFEIGLIAAIPFLAQIAQIASAYLVDITGKRKLITIRSLIWARQVWWLLIPLPFLAGSWRITALLGIFIISSIAAMMANAGWMSWVADLVPDRLRGRYFGFRSATLAFSTIAATLAGGAILDYFKSRNLQAHGFAIIFGIACLFAIVALFLMKKLPDKPMVLVKVQWTYLLEPLKNKSFRHLIKVFFAWNFALGISAAFFTAHMLTNLKMSFTQIALYSAAASMTAILLNRPWGVLVDRFGSKPVIAICAFGISLVPLIWWIPRPGHLAILAFEAVYSGALWTGFNLAAFNIPIANSPKKSRTTYLAMFSVISGIGFFIASILGGTLAETWKGIHYQLGFQTVVNYHILFTISSVLRILAACMALGFHEPAEKDLPAMIQFMSGTVIKQFLDQKLIVYRISNIIPIKRLGKSRKRQNTTNKSNSTLNN
jgi:MFS family permease